MTEQDNDAQDTGRDVAGGGTGTPAGFDEQGESLDERGLGTDVTPANPLSPDAGISSAPDAAAARGTGAPELDVAARRREEGGDPGAGGG